MQVFEQQGQQQMMNENLLEQERKQQVLTWMAQKVQRELEEREGKRKKLKKNQEQATFMIIMMAIIAAIITAAMIFGVTKQVEALNTQLNPPKAQPEGQVKQLTNPTKDNATGNPATDPSKTTTNTAPDITKSQNGGNLANVTYHANSTTSTTPAVNTNVPYTDLTGQGGVVPNSNASGTISQFTYSNTNMQAATHMVSPTNGQTLALGTVPPAGAQYIGTDGALHQMTTEQVNFAQSIANLQPANIVSNITNGDITLTGISTSQIAIQTSSGQTLTLNNAALLPTGTQITGYALLSSPLATGVSIPITTKFSTDTNVLAGVQNNISTFNTTSTYTDFRTNLGNWVNEISGNINNNLTGVNVSGLIGAYNGLPDPGKATNAANNIIYEASKQLPASLQPGVSAVLNEKSINNAISTLSQQMNPTSSSNTNPTALSILQRVADGSIPVNANGSVTINGTQYTQAGFTQYINDLQQKQVNDYTQGVVNNQYYGTTMPGITPISSNITASYANNLIELQKENAINKTFINNYSIGDQVAITNAISQAGGYPTNFILPQQQNVITNCVLGVNQSLAHATDSGVATLATTNMVNISTNKDIYSNLNNYYQSYGSLYASLFSASPALINTNVQSSGQSK